LGVDIGTSSIKIAQLKMKDEGAFVLETYGVVKVAYPGSQKPNFDVIAETASILKKLLVEAKATAKRVIASLPNNVVFVSMIELPQMSGKELKSAVEWEARRYVPLPLKEVTLSWSIVEAEQGQGQMKILLTAVPTRVIDNYLKMFKLAGLEPLALEIEALALIRSLVGNSKNSFIVVDIGARTTSVNLVDKGYLRISRSLEIGGDAMTQAISKSLRINFVRAEKFKRDIGVSGKTHEMPQTIKPVIDTIKSEILQLIKIYESSGETINEIIFAGAGAKLPGLLDTFFDLGVKARIGDPLQFVSYKPEIKTHLSSVSLDLSVAFGLAMRQ
jgi:type IV pilus assembly protein PilM